MARLEARLFNGSALLYRHTLSPVPNAAGALPAAFPATMRAFGELKGAPLAALLAFYAVDVPANLSPNEQRVLLGCAIGVRCP